MIDNLHEPLPRQPDRAAPNGYWDAKRQLAETIRQLAEAAVTCQAPEDELLTISQELADLGKRLADFPKVFGRTQHMEAGLGTFSEIFDEVGPLNGLSNPVAPPLKMWFEDDVAYGTVTMGWRFEGPPGCVHGGYVAALFDELLGTAQFLAEQPGMTGKLSVKYRRPTPLEKPLQLCARIHRVEGRKTFVTGHIEVDGNITAECECIFIQPREMGRNDT